VSNNGSRGRRWVAVLAASLLSACAAWQRPGPAPIVDPAKVSSFQLDGRINLRVQKEGYPGRVRWHHSPLGDELWFYSPLGATVARLRQDASGALLITSDGREHRAKDLQQLAFSVLGWDLPVAGLPYWVRGLEWPGAAAEQETWDEQGRPKQLSQAGWRISYLDWTPAGVAGLPSKLDVQGERLRLRLLVEKWSVEDDLPAAARHGPTPPSVQAAGEGGPNTAQ
jgi:outer membrane lipoprotein LolB